MTFGIVQATRLSKATLEVAFLVWKIYLAIDGTGVLGW
jgi:hypothetical protein